MKASLSILALAALAIITCLWSCDKTAGKAKLTIRLHDTPVDADEVVVEIIEVRIHAQGGWQTLSTNDGLYDLLELQDGVDTVLVPPQQIPSGTVSQVRFILGDENHVMVDSVNYPLTLSSQDESGLKLNIHQDLEAGENYVLVVDFDAAQSVLQTGNGTFKLKPVLSAAFELE